MTKRRALAVTTAIRNVPLAFLIASQNFGGTAVAPVVVLMASYTMIASVAYGKFRTNDPGQRGAQGPVA
jgi:predicted Na+-dependent transporter